MEVSENVPSLEDQIFDAYESGVGLVWLVQALILIGEAKPDPHHRLRLLEMLQSMLAYKGIDSGLIGAIEGAKRAMPEFEALQEELQSLSPENVRRWAEGSMSPEEIKADAERMLLSIFQQTASIPADGPEAAELRSMLLQAVDPQLGHAERVRVQQALHDKLTRWRAAANKET